MGRFTRIKKQMYNFCEYQAVSIDKEVILKTSECNQYFPFLRSKNGNITMYHISPLHGRSYLVSKTTRNRYIVTKGNGLCYSEMPFLYTPEMPTDVWGLLLETDAIRDFHCGQDVQSLGIKTNQMECVMRLNYPIYIAKTNAHLSPTILQYSVECPYRIADAPFMPNSSIAYLVGKWKESFRTIYKSNYQYAADTLINYLRILHNNGILHNALSEHNFTWALELVDFELCHTPQHPYSQEDYLRHVPDLFDREILDIYKVILYIAGCLQEKVNFEWIDGRFQDFGFDLKAYQLI